MPGRTDPRLPPPPVNIARRQAAVNAGILTRGASRTADGADRFAARQGAYASVPLRLRINRAAGPNTKLALRSTIPSGRARRKAGYPPPTIGGPEAANA